MTFSPLASLSVPLRLLSWENPQWTIDEEDQGTTVEVNQFLADNIPNATIKVIPDVGHFYQLEKSAEFNNDLRSFLKQVAA